MTEREIPRLEIACEFLDAAIEFFLAQTNFFCAIHLASAAEELLGAHMNQVIGIAITKYEDTWSFIRFLISMLT